MVPCGAASDAGPWLPQAGAVPGQYALALVTAILLLGSVALVLWAVLG